MTLKILYLVHNTRDPAVERRTRMLLAGGASVLVAGFRRAAEPPAQVAGAPVIDLGRSYDAKLGQRIALTLKSALRMSQWRKQIESCELIVARNLETLLLAVRARAISGSKVPIVYECLDIHRLMLGTGVPNRVMRSLERRLLAQCALLIVSSPAFKTQYFDAVQHVSIPTLLLENKVLAVDGAPKSTAAVPARPLGPPWRIGWFGMIRCRRSFEILKRMTERFPGKVEVTIRGIPTPAVFPDFAREVAAAPGISFEGAYKADQLASLYAAVHFTWAIDFYEEGQNSNWLLPNRLYEGPAHGAVPIALRTVETGRWLESRGAGVVIDDVGEAEGVLNGMDQSRYIDLFKKLQHLEVQDLYTFKSDCTALVDALTRLTSRDPV